MDVDPLADTPPPRYAVESDEEDEYNPLQKSSLNSDKLPPPEIKIVGQITANRPLMLTSGNAGKYWAKGCQLGEQTGAVYVEKTQVGLVFTPSWSKSSIIVSETFARLPIAYMHPYAQALIDQLNPSSLSLLDTYPTPTYISSEPIAIQDAPIRYLSTFKVDSPISPSAASFPPPNFIHSTVSATFLSYVASSSRPNLNATLLLLPFPRVPAPAPKVLGHSDFSHLPEDEYQWPSDVMNSVQNLLFFAIGEKPDGNPSWRTPANSKSSAVGSPRDKAPVDGGMYI